jgi:putative transcriptional regulator
MDILEDNIRPARSYSAPADVDVRAIRFRLHVTQAEFARRFGFSAATVRDWEQRRRRPEASARPLLMVIDKAPDLVKQVLDEAAG